MAFSVTLKAFEKAIFINPENRVKNLSQEERKSAFKIIRALTDEKIPDVKDQMLTQLRKTLKKPRPACAQGLRRVIHLIRSFVKGILNTLGLRISSASLLKEIIHAPQYLSRNAKIKLRNAKRWEDADVIVFGEIHTAKKMKELERIALSHLTRKHAHGLRVLCEGASSWPIVEWSITQWFLRFAYLENPLSRAARRSHFTEWDEKMAHKKQLEAIKELYYLQDNQESQDQLIEAYKNYKKCSRVRDQILISCIQKQRELHPNLKICVIGGRNHVKKDDYHILDALPSEWSCATIIFKDTLRSPSDQSDSEYVKKLIANI